MSFTIDDFCFTIKNVFDGLSIYAINIDTLSCYSALVYDWEFPQQRMFQKNTIYYTLKYNHTLYNIEDNYIYINIRFKISDISPDDDFTIILIKDFTPKKIQHNTLGINKDGQAMMINMDLSTDRYLSFHSVNIIDNIHYDFNNITNLYLVNNINTEYVKYFTNIRTLYLNNTLERITDLTFLDFTNIHTIYIEGYPNILMDYIDKYEIKPCSIRYL